MYCANSLSRLRLRVARLYLHSGISHWADIYIQVEIFRHDVRPETDIYRERERERDRERERERKSVPLNSPESSLHSQLLLLLL